MISVWKSIKYRAYHYLLEAAKANRGSKLFQKLDSMAQAYHLAYENYDYDFMSNGEYFLASRLSSIGALESVFDVGANIGDYSRIICSLNNQCCVIAFEPVPSTFAILKQNTQSLKVELQNYALGNFSGKSLISVVPNNSGVSSMVEGMQDGGGRVSEKIEIQVVKGSDFLSDSGIELLSLLKIDTEGFESEVLKGFGAAIKGIDVIQFEYGKANLFSRYFLYDYFKDYANLFFIGKLYPDGVNFYDDYTWTLDDLNGPNYVMVSKRRGDIKSAIAC